MVLGFPLSADVDDVAHLRLTVVGKAAAFRLLAADLRLLGGVPNQDHDLGIAGTCGRRFGAAGAAQGAQGEPDASEAEAGATPGSAPLERGNGMTESKARVLTPL
ncbi:hypothetical protein [uncultured Bosea sp.]|uniref:hypothetical protein n=1 Tax=uncultured Bosea sp. TaxID=211457 RepID=UPI0025DF6421|nr:hypothetical protein [uncultured Bosea sp.]